MNGYFCPVEGCDFGKHEQKSESQVTRHINAKSGEDHADVDRLRKLVAEQGEDDEGNEDSDGGDSEEDEPTDEGSDGTESDPEEESDMPTDEEYQQQYDGQEEEEEQNDGSGDGDDSGGGSTSLLPALDQRTMLMLVGLAVVLVVAYTLLNRDGDAAEMDVEETDDSDDGGEEVTLIE